MGVQLRVQGKEAHEALMSFADEAHRMQTALSTLGETSHPWSHQELGDALKVFHTRGLRLLDEVLGSGLHALELRKALHEPATEAALCRFSERIAEIARRAQTGSYPRPTETKLRVSGRDRPTSMDAQHRQLADEVRQGISAIMKVTHKIVAAIEDREDFASTTAPANKDAATVAGAQAGRTKPATIPPMSTAPPGRVFISYSHDTPTHSQRVRELADRLRGDGLDCEIDQHVLGSPAEGWPLWMERRIDQAAYVLVACTDVYLRRYDGNEEPGKGRGATWEAILARQDLYESSPNNAKFVPILFDGASVSDIPKPLRPHTYYKMPDSYEELFRYITKQPAVIPKPIGAPKKLPPR